MTYEHYIYTLTPESLAAAYQQAGFIAEVERGGGLVMVYTDYNEAVREKVERIAEEQGADYDGGGMYFGPLADLSREEAS